MLTHFVTYSSHTTNAAFPAALLQPPSITWPHCSAAAGNSRDVLICSPPLIRLCLTPICTLQGPPAACQCAPQHPLARPSNGQLTASIQTMRQAFSLLSQCSLSLLELPLRLLRIQASPPTSSSRRRKWEAAVQPILAIKDEEPHCHRDPVHHSSRPHAPACQSICSSGSRPHTACEEQEAGVVEGVAIPCEPDLPTCRAGGDVSEREEDVGDQVGSPAVWPTTNARRVHHRVGEETGAPEALFQQRRNKERSDDTKCDDQSTFNRIVRIGMCMAK
mmetsp:Transcript_43688/g.91465  ORF Transcript_43688/g.91465 Transcript_43688/m.91465 type:complete len:276 (-) Transcript_43688:212-1039(-)